MAARDLSAAMVAAIAAGTVRWALLYEGEFNSSGSTEYLRLWSGIGDLSWDSKTWTGAGKLMGVSPVDEHSDLTAKGFQVTLSGVALTDVARALAGGQKNRSGKVWVGLFDSTWTLLDPPYLLVKGRFDRIALEDTGGGCTISAFYESVLVDLERPRERRYTQIDQQRDYPTDKGFSQVPALVNLEVQWGS